MFRKLAIAASAAEPAAVKTGGTYRPDSALLVQTAPARHEAAVVPTPVRPRGRDCQGAGDNPQLELALD